jgi:hypothetical protein
MQQKVQVLGTGVDVSLFELLVGPARCSNGLSNKGLIVASGTVRIPMVASGIKAVEEGRHAGIGREVADVADDLLSTVRVSE